MNRTPVVAQLGAVCLCWRPRVRQRSTSLLRKPGPAQRRRQHLPSSESPGPEDTPTTTGTTNISSRGERVESLANTVVRRVAWEEGTTYEGSISYLVFRTAGKPDVGHGHRVVARWVGDASWQVTIFMRVVDRSTEPPMVTDLPGEFYYDEEKDEFAAANGRARFALTDRNPCTSGQPIWEETAMFPVLHEAPTTLLVTCGKTHNLLICDRSTSRGSILSFEAYPSRRKLAAPISPSVTLPCGRQG
jgi:hypothetical protein